MKKIDIAEAGEMGRLLHRIGKERMLITAGRPGNLGTMTASWGGLGVLWHRPMATIFVRPERHTYGFLEAEESFSIAFFGPQYEEALTFCGKNSGRDVDKLAVCGFTVAQGSEGGLYFEEAELALLCKKRYRAPLELDLMTGFDPGPYYGSHGGVHTMYMGEIVEVYTA